MGARHLYIHLPFCSSRCGYCDFVTVVGRHGDHKGYVDAVLRELDLRADLLDGSLDTLYLGGGTPTFIQAAELERLLGALPEAAEVTVEANPETVTTELASLLVGAGVDRVSLGAQSFAPRLLAVLDRVAGPDDVGRAVGLLRAAGIDNISLDLIYGIPGQEPADLHHDLARALALEPEHISAYELEAKPGTRFTHAHGEELEHQAESLETYFERVVETLTAAGYRWYETANFCRSQERSQGADLRCRHNLGYWLGHDYLGLGVGAVSTIAGRRWRNAPSLARYLGALASGRLPSHEGESLPPSVRDTERIMLGLRLDEPLPLAGLEEALDPVQLERLEGLSLVVRDSGTLTLTPRGRFLGGGVTARLLS
jgi:oxygen-independent coproporphyrinogen-3 oxidase